MIERRNAKRVTRRPDPSQKQGSKTVLRVLSRPSATNCVQFRPSNPAANPDSPRPHNGHDENQYKIFCVVSVVPLWSHSTTRRQTVGPNRRTRFRKTSRRVYPGGLCRIDRSRLHRPADRTATRLSSTLRLGSTELAEVRPEGSSPKSGVNPAARISELGKPRRFESR